MKRRRIFSLIATTIASLLVVVSFQLLDLSKVAAQSNASLLVSAAASLQNAMEEIKPLYQQTKSNVNINYNFGASGALQQQIEQGAPVDIFISAGKKQMDALEQKGLLLTGSRTNLANNRLVLIVPSNSSVGINSLSNLTDSKFKKIAVGEPRSVPAGQYADQAFKQSGIYDQIKPKLVYGNNVRQVLAAVESGNADAGLVYASDAKISNKVKVAVVVDEKSHSPIVYPMAVLKASKNSDVAKTFVQFLSGDQSKNILQKYGFLVQ
ncbi:molybdate ABC transporter substrate-binding protein [Aetokthonos hydrillicola Thurmond2011]|jgi:molybdate transport system substrate-binding protein|uniref:Molybdate ABC transporter substrate-binding protein n=1 Tax=Aetokthonos hydrillicola Thurmond2011 TaxID=2712845 RepID=A0AAP5I7H9_9CYAN|nr:molybdate ABC transporter substrate-binding protein [Aetokthonos hydrillicola]MBO3458317.1 molybdate ABC transporter substrate-binding protein [Aetokthonos hydrillicola CCALA 1050]MBW4585880.1 molybdate ABC transporter substrate-binding protein [Aetokthonos hydrillicola CCALA 1050]MDR9893895.1 molybdate ABC transporter substrate-binding protein [Aetokthonos hydrillicola Thurmond2011]